MSDTIVTRCIDIMARNEELILRASKGIKQSLETAKEEMMFRGSSPDGFAMKKVDNGLELINQVIECLTPK